MDRLSVRPLSHREGRSASTEQAYRSVSADPYLEKGGEGSRGSPMMGGSLRIKPPSRGTGRKRLGSSPPTWHRQVPHHVGGSPPQILESGEEGSPSGSELRSFAPDASYSTGTIGGARGGGGEMKDGGGAGGVSRWAVMDGMKGEGMASGVEGGDRTLFQGTNPMHQSGGAGGGRPGSPDPCSNEQRKSVRADQFIRRQSRALMHQVTPGRVGGGEAGEASGMAAVTEGASFLWGESDEENEGEGVAGDEGNEDGRGEAGSVFGRETWLNGREALGLDRELSTGSRQITTVHFESAVLASLSSMHSAIEAIWQHIPDNGRPMTSTSSSPSSTSPPSSSFSSSASRHPGHAQLGNDRVFNGVGATREARTIIDNIRSGHSGSSRGAGGERKEKGSFLAKQRVAEAAHRVEMSAHHERGAGEEPSSRGGKGGVEAMIEGDGGGDSEEQ